MPQLRVPRIIASFSIEPARLTTPVHYHIQVLSHGVCVAGEGPEQRGRQDGPGVVRVHDGHEARLE
eukprot:11858330-Alexandrium_andersonii.AAC.1